MNAEIQRPTEALDDHHGSAAPIGDAVTAHAAPEELVHRFDRRVVAGRDANERPLPSCEMLRSDADCPGPTEPDER